MEFKKINPIRNKKVRLFFYLFLSWLLIHCACITYDGLHDYLGNADIAIVLGNTVFEDSTLSPWLKGRVDAAYDLYKKGRVKKLFVSGGHGLYHVPEGDAMKKYLLSLGVAPNDVIADNHGENTYFTAKDFISLNDSLHFSKAIAVSSFYHITRCKYIFKKLGYKNIEGVGSKEYFWKDINGLVREFFAFYKYVIVY